MDEELRDALNGIRSEIESLRAETNANFQVVRTQLNTVEYGVLTLAQKLLADSEVRDIQSR